MPKVAAIAVDAAEWSVVERLMAAGQLPNLKHLHDKSARCRLDNVMPYRSELAWARFLTGRDAGEQGFWGQLVFDPATYECYGRGTLDAPAFYGGSDARTTVAFDLIHSVLNEGVRGDQVTGWGCHSPQYPRASLPHGLLTDIDRRFGTNPAFANDFDLGWHEPDYLDNLAAACSVGASRRMDIVDFLQERNPGWDLLMTCISEVHSLAHHAWHGIDDRHPLHGHATSDLAAERMTDVFKVADSAVGRFVERLPADAHVVVFALHGMQPADDLPAMLLLPELLHRAAFGSAILRDPDQAAWRRAGCPPVVPGRYEEWHSYARARFTDGPRDQVRHMTKRVLPGTAYDRVRRFAGKPAPKRLGDLTAVTGPEVVLEPGAWGEARESLDWQPTVWYQRHWPRMRAFVAPTFTDAHIRINLAGREAKGLVDPDDYGRACDEIVELVAGCTDARTGRPALGDVIRLRAEDPRDPEGPDADLLLVWAEASDALEHPTLGTVGPFPHMRTGSHSTNGFAFLSGPGIDPGDLGRRDAADLTPTLLAMLGEGQPEGMIGRSLLPSLSPIG